MNKYVSLAFAAYSAFGTAGAGYYAYNAESRIAQALESEQAVVRQLAASEEQLTLRFDVERALLREVIAMSQSNTLTFIHAFKGALDCAHLPYQKQYATCVTDIYSTIPMEEIMEATVIIENAREGHYEPVQQ